MGYDVFFGRKDYQEIKEPVDFFYKYFKRFIIPQVNNVEILDGKVLRITIPDKPVTRRKLSEEALKENMDKISYEQIKWENTNDMNRDDIWF